MNKMKQRETMKKLALLNVAIDAAKKIVEVSRVPNFFSVMMTSSIESEAMSRSTAISTTPTKYFRTDRPVVDKRRQRRFNRGSKVYLVRGGGVLMLTQEYLHEAISYNKETGDFIWKVRPPQHFKRINQCKNWNG